MRSGATMTPPVVMSGELIFFVQVDGWRRLVTARTHLGHLPYGHLSAFEIGTRAGPHLRTRSNGGEPHRSVITRP